MQLMIPLESSRFYHIFDRGVNRENIFLEERNYEYFLRLYIRHITPVAETYAYCLLRNHFHFLVRIQTNAVITTVSASKAFNNFLTAYAKAINKGYGRTGALFQHHFGRIPIHSDRYFRALVRYIHHNPCKHGFVTDFRDWPYSSYHNLMLNESAPVDPPDVLMRFGGLREFRRYHAAQTREKRISRFTGNDND
jgi:putative transposase